MKYHWFILSSFFFLFVLVYQPAVYGVVGEVSVTKAEGPVDIEADELTYDRETQTYEGHGQVEVSRGDLSLKADHARLNMATKDMEAWGNVLLREGEDVIECQRLEVNLDTRLGKIHQARLYLKDQNVHITGGEVDKLGENHYRVRDGSFTTCDAKQPPWKFTVKEIEVQEMALGGWGIGKGVVFYFEDIPALYFPWGIFPVRQDRQSGFLMPSAGHSGQYGFKMSNGFFWAIAKNMDATLYLDYLGTRGFKEGVEYNYAFTRETKGQANFYYIDDQSLHKDRYAFFIEHEQKLPYDIYLKGNVNHVSDHQYFLDYKNEDLPETARMAEIDATSINLLRSVVFGGKDWDKFSLLVNNEVFDDFTQRNNEKTVQKLPQISFFAHPQSLFKTPLFYDVTSSYTNFWRERGIESHRGDFFPTISYPARLFNVLKFESDVGLRETFYRSTNDYTGTFEGWQSRETLEANTQMSAEFYRVYDAEALSKIADLFKVSKWMHIIEPSISYQYSPPVNQSHIPVYDDVDRIPFTNQITYGFTQRLMGKPQSPQSEEVSSGAVEYAKLKIFQSYSLSDPSWFNSQFIDSEGKKRSFSNIEGQLWWNFSPYLWAYLDTEFNPYRAGFDLFNFVIGAKDLRSDTVTVGYAGQRSTFREINFNARVKTISPIYLFGAYYYDLFNAIWVYWMFGAEYQTQCWSAGFLLEGLNRSLAGNRKSDLKYTFYFNLLNIGSFGKRPYFMKM